MWLLSPSLTIEVAVAYGLGEMVGLDGGSSFEVGNGTGETQDTVVGSCRKLEAIDDLA